MQTQFICRGCTYRIQRRVTMCPMCGALMLRIEGEAIRAARAGLDSPAVAFIG